MRRLLLLPFLFAAPEALAARAAPAGYGPVSLGMAREEAVAAGGPEAFLAPLCGQPEGLVFPLADPALAARAAEPVTVMAMFEAGRVSEMDAALDGLAGTPADREACRARHAATVSRLAAAYGPPGRTANGDTSLLREERTPFRLAAATAEVISRWYPGAGRCHVHARWTAEGAARVIP